MAKRNGRFSVFRDHFYNNMSAMLECFRRNPNEQIVYTKLRNIRNGVHKSFHVTRSA